MAQYVKIPKDLSEIKQKFMFGLTKRQLICFGIGFAVGVPMYFLTRGFLGLSGGIFMLGFTAAPAIIAGIYKKNGIFFEEHIKNMIQYFKSPRKRTYRPINMYEAIQRQIEYNTLKRTLIRAEGGTQNAKRK